MYIVHLYYHQTFLEVPHAVVEPGMKTPEEPEMETQTGESLVPGNEATWYVCVNKLYW